MMKHASTFFAVLLFAAQASASQIEPLDLKRLEGDATLVVTGYVTRVRTTRNDNAVLEKRATVLVTKVLHGTYASRSVEIRMRQGLVFFDRMLTAGDSGVFYLLALPEGGFEAAYPGSFALFEKGTVKRP